MNDECYIIVRNERNQPVVTITTEVRPALVALPENCPNDGCGKEGTMVWEPFDRDPMWCWWTCSDCGYGVMFRCPDDL